MMAYQVSEGSGKGWVTSEYGMRRAPPRSARRARRHGGNQSGRTLEIQTIDRPLIARVTDQEALGERTVWIDCDVPGGWRNAHSFHHRSVCRSGAGIRAADRGRNLEEFAADRHGGGYKRRHVDDRALLDLAYEEIRALKWI